ncbi:histidinol phosphate phosphatase H [Phlegmacium glaucopus]|nr:histidinol phosphate phosphatase H [Phlegmacium glaucopus]
MPHSLHSHSGQYCKHASGLLEEVVQEAIQQRFQIYGLTEHVPRYREVDLYPEEMGVQIDTLAKQFDDFIVEAHRLKHLYAPQITLLVGLETEYITNADLDGLENLLQRHGDRVEYIVGSIHHVNGIPIDFDPPTFRKALESFGIENENVRQEAFLLAYFDAQYELLERFKPEVIAHFDLCRLHNPDLRFADFPVVRKRVERNIRFAVDYGALFEINAAAFRKKWPTPYPAEDVVEIIHSHNGRFTLSDDSHGPHAVGLNYHRLPEYLQSQAISELWVLQHASIPNAAGRTIQATRLSGEWLDHEFWHARSI